MSSNSTTTLEGSRLGNPESDGERAGYLTGEPYRNTPRQRRGGYRRRRNPGGLEAPTRGFRPRSRQDSRERLEDRDERAEFDDLYRDKAGEHDREFIGRYDDDLNNTLIFAGLFSAVTSTFISMVQPQLQPDSGDETASLLRVLIYKTDNTTFGNDIPTLPQWTGPPPTMVQVQSLLYASLVTSLFAAFLAMLGKQWLNRYASVGTRGSAIERNRDRQRKLNGTVTWGFNYVMEALPLMLRGSLFLLGCALSLYLWGIDTTIASVVFGVTSFGVAFYGFIVVAGVVSVDCPYQTPYARLFRHITCDLLPLITSMLGSAASSVASDSESVAVLATCWRELKRYKRLKVDCPCVATVLFMSPIYLILFPIYFLVLPTVMVYDGCLGVLSISRAFSDLADRARIWLKGTHKSIPKAIASDLQCILWMLRASTDKAVHFSALKLLAAMTAMDFSPALTSACFDILIGCVVVVDGKAVATRMSEELAEVSAHCCLRTLSHLAATDPALSTVQRVRKRYTAAFPQATNFDALHPNHSLKAIHNIFYSLEPKIQWTGYQLLSEDQVTLAHTLAELANKRVSEATQSAWDVFFRGRRRVKVPRWILRFALHSLSQDPLPPTSIVINCLSMIAIDLGQSTTAYAPIPDESTRLEEISNLITHTLFNMATSEDAYGIQCKRKAVTALFPYAVWRERVQGDSTMMDTVLTAFIVFGPGTTLWHPILPSIPRLFNAASSHAVVVVSPHVPWDRVPDDKSVVAAWAAATSAVQRTEQVERKVVDALLQIASVDRLRQHIPDDHWSWLNTRPSLPPVCRGRSIGTKTYVVRRIGALGDIKTLTSYLLLVWSEWDTIGSPKLDPAGSAQCLSEMQRVISWYLRGPEMRGHREELVKRLDRILKQLDEGLGYLRLYKLWIEEDDVQWARAQYEKLREVLLGMNTTGTVMRIPT